MDESLVYARGMEPLKPWFAKIDSAKDMVELQRVMADMHDILVTDPFALASQQDPHKPSWVLADIGASGLGLPDRDYYLKPEARFKEAREKYVAHITAMFKLAGWNDKNSAAAAQTISAILQPPTTTLPLHSCRQWPRTSTGRSISSTNRFRGMSI
jgi:endothelin-converting enzyme/putative endopeptidase